MQRTVSIDIPRKRKRQNKLSIVAISDLHNCFPADLPKADVLIVAGDMTLDGSAIELQAFAKWLRQQPFKHKVVVAGNHDVSLDSYNYSYLHHLRVRQREPQSDPRDLIQQFKEEFIYLENESANIEGLVVFGSPYTPKYYQWAFNYEEGWGEKAAWRFIPKDADIVITHGPAFGANDLTSKGKKAGCPELRKVLQKQQPPLHIHGHIHESFGHSLIDETVSVNVAYVKRNYKPRSDPFFIFQM